MLYDCFTFFNELDLLEIRLEELYSVVDKFVLVEADLTHSGNPKPMMFAENRERYKRFEDKLIYVPVHDMPREAETAWVRENFQRNAILRGLVGAAPDDFVIISDLDEIPRADLLALIKQSAGDGFGLRLWLYSMRLNYLNVAGPEVHCVWPVVIRRRLIETPQHIRDIRMHIDRGTVLRAVDDAGWHFTSVGDNDTLRNKIRNFAHQEVNAPERLAAIDVDQFIREGRDLFGRDQYAWACVTPRPGWQPQFVLDNLDRFAALIAPSGAATEEVALKRAVANQAAYGRLALMWQTAAKQSAAQSA
jgi:beta-1,4-mannosyl-glycoprotein beta-1,4-N-acetylglucosaminyltransferase